LEFDEESSGKRWFSWWRECQRGSVLAATAGVDRRRGVAATTRFFRKTHFFRKDRGFLEWEKRENEGIKNMKKMYCSIL
jgi:hypothetical protein